MSSRPRSTVTEGGNTFEIESVSAVDHLVTVNGSPMRDGQGRVRMFRSFESALRASRKSVAS